MDVDAEEGALPSAPPSSRHPDAMPRSSEDVHMTNPDEREFAERERDKEKRSGRSRDEDYRDDRRDKEKERERDRDREREKDRDRGHSRRDERRDDRYDDRRGRDDRRERDSQREKERERERERERDRDRERDRERERARDREREKRDNARPGEKRRRDEEEERETPRKDEKEREKIPEPAAAVPAVPVVLAPGIAPPVYIPPSLPSKPKAATPVSVEDLIKQRAAAEAASSRPVFMSKAQRQKQEEEEKRRHEEEEKQRLVEEAKTREAYLDAMREKERKERDDNRRREWDRDKEREREREREKEKRANDSKGKFNPTDLMEKARQAEMQAIKEEKLGLKKDKKKLVKQSDKFKVQFNWDADDDTSKLADPLAAVQPEIRPLFGRGFIAGIDKKEQWKKMQEASHTVPRTGFDNDEEKRLSQLTRTERDVVDKHWSEKPLEKMTERDWRIFREDFNISTRGGSIPNPLRSWRESSLPEDILKAVEKMGFEKPSPIQRQAIPIGLQGRDILGVAETGSGKTAAFVIPMLVFISRLPKMTIENAGDGPYALIMAPTRELVQQIEQQLKMIAEFMDIRAVAIVGGVSIEEQGFSLRHGAEIIIATPGRLVDCIDRRYIVLNQCNYVVLDEADRMIDLGFEPQVLKILESMPAGFLKSENEDEAALQEAQQARVYRTTHLYSATMPVSVERLARKYLRRPAYVAIGEVGKAVDRIEQRIEFVKSDMEKRKILINLLTTGPPPPIMIFVNTKKTGDGLGRALDREGYKTAVIHSGKSQEQRELAMEGFRANRFDILVATDVAGRGIDVKGITHVINYDMTATIADYTHRIGRTGRAGSSGLATSFITNEDSELFYDLKQMLLATGNVVPPELGKHPAAQVKPGTAAASRRDTVILAQG